MKHLLLLGVIVLGLLGGCSSEQQPKKVEPTKEVVKVEEVNPLEKALKKFKHVKIEEVSDNRETTGQISVVVKLDESIGEGSQVANVIQRSDDFVKALDKKPKTLTVGTMYKGQRVFQFTKNVETGEIKVEKSTPYIDEYLKKTKTL